MEVELEPPVAYSYPCLNGCVVCLGLNFGHHGVAQWNLLVLIPLPLSAGQCHTVGVVEAVCHVADPCLLAVDWSPCSSCLIP